MDFEKFLHWLNANCKDPRSTRTLGGRAYIKAELIESGRFLLIEYSKNSQLCCITMDKLTLIFDKYFELEKHRHMASQYTDPEWQNTPSRICAPYAAALIRDFENDFIPPQEDINTATPSGDQVMQLNEYIESILPLIKASRKFRSDNSHSAKYVRYLYTQAFYGFDEFAKRQASVEAKRLYSSRGFTDNLSQQSVDNQRQFDPEGRRNGDFHLEHVFTGSSFRKAVENLSEEELTIENIETIVNEKFLCAWILKTEDAKLDEAGYRSNRPENPIDAYTEVGIILED
jgi:hypothetical protein